MNALRRCRALAFAGGWLALAVPASAHRLDEYLQATRLSIDTTRVDVEMDLTAGVALASKVFAWIDANRDGEISSVEGEAYAREVLGSCVLKVDGIAVPLTLVASRFPEFREMSLGEGTIRLRVTAKVPAAPEGHRQISFLNMHRAEVSVYLVNALVPENPRVQIADQRRDAAQHGLTLDYTVTGEGRSDRTAALLIGLAMAVCLFVRHGHTLRAFVITSDSTS